MRTIAFEAFVDEEEAETAVEMLLENPNHLALIGFHLRKGEKRVLVPLVGSELGMTDEEVAAQHSHAD